MRCWSALRLVSALRSTGSAAVRSALFVGFIATMAERDFSCPYIIGYGSSPSRCGRSLALDTDGQSRDIPASGAILLRVMWPSDPGGTTMPRIPASHMLRSTMKTVSLPRVHHFVAHSHTPRNRCVRFVFGVAAASRNTRFQATC